MLIYKEAKAGRKVLEILTNNRKTDTNFQAQIPFLQVWNRSSKLQSQIQTENSSTEFYSDYIFQIRILCLWRKDRHKIVSVGQKQKGIFLWNTDEASEVGKIIKCHKPRIANESMFLMPNRVRRFWFVLIFSRYLHGVFLNIYCSKW